MAIAASAARSGPDHVSDPAVPHSATQLDLYLAALYSEAPTGSFVELRFRTAAGMGQSFHRVEHLASLASAITHHAARTDLYIGVLPRGRRGGTRGDLVPEGRVLWIDADTDDAVHALTAFSPPPSVIVLSGSAGDLHGNRHAYWLLSAPAPIDAIEHANRGLAIALNADVSSFDAGRLLRPPGDTSLNFKHRPPTAVLLERCSPTARHPIADIARVLNDRVGPIPQPRHALAGARVTDDPLLATSPRLAIERLTGQHVDRHGKIACPFHDDANPSLHVYSEPERGWFCYGCRRGGSLVDFAALLYGTSTRGKDFIALRERLMISLDLAERK